VEARGWHYDGQSGIRHDVRVVREGDDLRMLLEDGRSVLVPAKSLVPRDSRPGAEVYGRSGTPGWRLGIHDPTPELAAVLPGQQLYGGWIDRFGLAKAAIAFALISAAVLFAAHNAPALLAPHVPQAWEEKFGNALVGNLGGKACAGADGQRALDKLAARLNPGGRPVTVRVVDLPMTNAFALPGGTIVIFDPLIEEAEGADEVAGVLAHEIAHIEKRHVTQALIRHYGVGLLLAGLGGTTGGNVDLFASAGHSRAAETEADTTAISMLRRAGINPSATAAFFKRVAGKNEPEGALSYLSSHPVSAERRRRFEAAAEPGAKYRPALSEEEWLALWDICFDGVPS
jgi:Zn-dependent protease with chaperone function